MLHKKTNFLSKTAYCITVFTLILLGCLPVLSQSNQEAKLIAKGATLTKLASDYTFTEGPAVDKAGNVYFTDQPNNRIMKWTTDGKISLFMDSAGRANGLYFDKAGNLLACADLDNQIWKITPDKKVTVLVNNVEGKKLNGPNDLWVHPKGGIYFTDPFYKRPYWKRTEKEIEKENVYYLAPNGTLKIVDNQLVRPNGIIGSPDGKMLYVADINDKKTYTYQIQADGSLSNRKLLIEMGSDGMTLDSKGNLYLTGKGVTVVNPAGEKIAHIDVPENWTANICFGGKKRKTLFITAMKSVYTLQMKVKGAF
jgi:gluconolactonase